MKNGGVPDWAWLIPLGISIVAVIIMFVALVIALLR